MSSEYTELSLKIDELTFWMKFSVWTTFVNILKATLREDVDKMVYELSDGDRSTRDIAQLLTAGGKRITHQTVKNMWQKWASIPLVMPAKTAGRYRRVVPLRYAGIDLPKLQGVSEERSAEEIE